MLDEDKPVIGQPAQYAVGISPAAITSESSCCSPDIPLQAPLAAE
jgi:hypothetical protein